MASANEIAESFADLFAGRSDGYGSVEGGCVKELVTVDTYAHHLWVPGHSIGVYPIVGNEWLGEAWALRMGGPVGNHFVVWGCSDIDNAEDPEAAWPLALNLHSALRALGIPAWIERTKSKGYHVWVFADEWIPAIVMRRALLFAHQVAGVAPTEVNPKQVDLKGKTWGNYVNLPYAKDWRGSGKREMVRLHDGEAHNLTFFVDCAIAERRPFDTFHAAAKLYKEPPKRSVGRRIEAPSGPTEELAGKLPGLAHKIWREGPLAGRDRSGTLQRLAYLCAEASVAPGDAQALIRDADERWGKFANRSDGEQQLTAILERAYA